MCAASGTSNILLKTYIKSIFTLSLDDLSSKYKSIEINTDMLCSALDKVESDLQTLNIISFSNSTVIEKLKLPVARPEWDNLQKYKGRAYATGIYLFSSDENSYLGSSKKIIYKMFLPYGTAWK